MVGKMVQNSQSLYSFTFNVVIVIHEYFYSHSATEFTFMIYIYSHLMVTGLCLVTFTIKLQSTHYIPSHSRLKYSAFSAHLLCASLGPSSCSECNMAVVGCRVTKEARPQTKVLHGLNWSYGRTNSSGFLIILDNSTKQSHRTVHQ